MAVGEGVTWRPVAKVSEVQAGNPKQVVLDGVVIGLYRIREQFFAMADVCPHQFAYLSEGYVEDEVVECPLHQATFHVPSGKVLSGPTKTDVQTFPAKVVEDQIFLGV
jgi:nitrite reductase/ring-hydroxylating ferredoxin subunit